MTMKCSLTVCLFLAGILGGLMVEARPQFGGDRQLPLFFPGNVAQQNQQGNAINTSTTTAAPTARPRGYFECMQRCPATSEYNPICATDNQNYHNESRFQCARRCGLNIAAVRMGTCSPA